MTKYEWETELKRNIHRLPDDEIKRVMEYYGELFDDKAERGKSETAIIYEFGNPADVADKIMSEYDGELKSDTEVDIPVPLGRAESESAQATRTDTSVSDDGGQRRNITIENTSARPSRTAENAHCSENNSAGLTSGGRILLFVLVNVLTCFAFFICLAAVWIVLGALTVAGGAIGLGGAAATVVSFGVLFGGHAGAGLAQLGMSVALIGIGILMTMALIKCVKLFGIVTVRIFVSIKNWLVPKEAENA